MAKVNQLNEQGAYQAALINEQQLEENIVLLKSIYSIRLLQIYDHALFRGTDK